MSIIHITILKLRRVRLPMRLLTCLSGLVVLSASALDYSALTNSVDAERATRYQSFRNFQIKGICGTVRLDLAANFGANTIRTYTPPTRVQLDQYRALGLNVIAGIWMPKQGENRDKAGTAWDFDYRKQGDKQVKDFEKTMDQIGDHPAILMWCLGNEVPLDPAYIETVNRMSQVVHKKFPKQLSSLTMINAPKEKIALIKKLAPDLDVIGYNSYGQGAVGSASQNLEQEWGRAYYVSEFGPQGPWWGRKTAWGEVYEQSYDAKLKDLGQSFEKINAAPHCLGSTMFLWGYWTQQKPTYFSAFLSPQGPAKEVDEQKLYITPMAEEFCHYWSGKYPAERAPILTNITLPGRKDQADLVVHAGQRFKASATATDPVSPAAALTYRWWILNKRGEAVVGPVSNDQPAVELEAPQNPGEDYCLMAYVIANNRRASGFTVPIKVEK